MSNPRLVLASGSAIRASLLRAAGLEFEQVRPDVDEAAIKKTLHGERLETLALELAEAKALAVNAPGALIIGSDQILEYAGRAFDKPENRRAAANRLAALQDDSHTLINAVAIAQDGAIIFRHIDRPRLHMRAMSEQEIERYLNAAGEGVLSSVGAYQVEALGATLLDKIEGDHFAVLGLSLLPVLKFLRARGVAPY